MLKSSVLGLAFSHSNQEAEAIESEASLVHSEFQDSQGCTEEPV